MRMIKKLTGCMEAIAATAILQQNCNSGQQIIRMEVNIIFCLMEQNIVECLFGVTDISGTNEK